jgi:hypothetical protein
MKRIRKRKDEEARMGKKKTTKNVDSVNKGGDNAGVKV